MAGRDQVPSGRRRPGRPRAELLRAAADRTEAMADVVRRRARSPLAFKVVRTRVGAWAIAVAVALCVAAIVADAEQTRRRWGDSATVLVAHAELRPGDVLGPSTVSRQEWPTGLVPVGALRELPDGRRVAVRVVPGGVITAAHLARPGAGATAAHLPEGAAAVSVPLGPTSPPMEVGDLVDVMAPSAGGDPWAGGGSPDGGDGVEVVARSAEVIGVDDGAVTLAVRGDEVRAVGAAVLGGNVTVALRG